MDSIERSPNFLATGVRAGLRHRSPYIRKTTQYALSPARPMLRYLRGRSGRGSRASILANSVPKAGTHLLDQVLAPIGALELGGVVSSRGSSFRFSPQADAKLAATLRRSTGGELVRAHLHHTPEVAAVATSESFVTLMVVRDPATLVVSSVVYGRYINRWHALHKHLSAPRTSSGALDLMIDGIIDRDRTVLPPLAERLAEFVGWATEPSVRVVRFEDLIAEIDLEVEATEISGIAEHLFRGGAIENRARELICSRKLISPAASHTYARDVPGLVRPELSSWQRERLDEAAVEFRRAFGY